MNAVISQMEPILYAEFMTSLIMGNFVADGAWCECYLGWRNGTVLPETKHELGNLIAVARNNGIRFDWPASNHEWLAPSPCDAIVIRTGDLPIAYFDVGYCTEGTPVTLKMKGALAKELACANLTLWARLKLLIWELLERCEYKR